MMGAAAGLSPTWATDMFKVYFSLPGSGQFLSGKDAAPCSDLQGLRDTLMLLKAQDDVVYAMHTPSAIRVQFLVAEGTDVRVIIDVPRQACGYSKVFSRSDLDARLASLMDSAFDPENAGFECEHW